jgi:Cu-Zn family superoxide dismutase
MSAIEGTSMRNQIEITTLALVTALLALPACKGEEEAGTRKAVAELRDADGKSVGTANFEEVATGVEIRFEGKNLPPGDHGFHIHTSGKCDAPSFESAGDHFNPTNAMHGLKNAQGPHVGDLPNLDVDDDGTAELTVLVKDATLADSGERSLLTGDGTALVVHAQADDQMTDPAGGAGARIACGVIKRP